MPYVTQGATLLGRSITALSAAMISVTPAFAAQPEPWQMGFQPSATDNMAQAVFMHNAILMPVITITTLVVLGLMIWAVVRYRKSANPTPATFSHNTTIEVIWTAVPALILILLAVPSYQLLRYQDVLPESVDLTIKTTGAQFNWTYEYPDYESFEVISNMKTDSQLEPGEPRLLAVDYNAKVPAGKTVRVIVTASDVIHAFAVPAFGVKKDAIPGRLNETWFKAPEETGVYYGQCSELCGPGHAFMPIAIEVVTPAEFELWTKQQMAEQGLTPHSEQVAAAKTTP